MSKRPQFARRTERGDDSNFPPAVQRGTEGVAQVEVTFMRTVRFECEGRHKGPRFYKGKAYTFDEPFANRWVKRGAAYVTSDGPPEPEEDERPQAVLQKGGASENLDRDDFFSGNAGNGGED